MSRFTHRWDEFLLMSNITLTSLVTAFVLMLTFSIQDAVGDGDVSGGNKPLSVAEMRRQVSAPRVYSVEAYVIHKDDECPPCPPNAVCETCVLGIYVADDTRPREPDMSTRTDVIYLQTNKAQSFQVGEKYLFRIKYQLMQNAAGAWLQTSPELIEYRSIGSAGRE